MEIIKKKKWLVIIILAILSIGAYMIISFSSGIEVKTVKVEKGLVRKLIEETGTVESDNSIIISSPFTGEVVGLTGSTGDIVTAGDLLLSNDEDVSQLDLKSLKAQLSGLEISYSHAKNTANKNKILYEQGAISQEEYNSALTLAKELEAQISSLRYSIESYAKSTGDSGVKSPMDGTITEVFVKEGEYITLGAPLFEITNLDKLFIKVNLIADDADLVNLGTEVLIYSPQINNSTTSNGQVRHIHLKAKEEVSGLGIIQKRVSVEIELAPDFPLRLGSDVDLAIIIDEKHDILRIPNSSIFKINENDYVYVAEDNKALLRQVTKGLVGDEFIEIVKGLSEGETIIKSPGNDIDDGVRITVYH